MRQNVSINWNALIEIGEIELEKVVRNILDPGTDSKPRKVTLTITIKPDEAKRTCAYLVSGSAKISNTASYIGNSRIGQQGGQVAMVEQDMQLSLFDTSNVEELQSGAAA